MRGYHYTTLSNWKVIKKEGLVPYLCNKPEVNNIPEVKEVYPNGVFGVWTWEVELSKDEEIGSILYQVGTKKEKIVVKLSYNYSDKDIVSAKGRRVHIFHNGNIGEWQYHHRARSYLIGRTIKSKEIKLCKVFKLDNILK